MFFVKISGPGKRDSSTFPCSFSLYPNLPMQLVTGVVLLKLLFT
jgi:hypothetical protein